MLKQIIIIRKTIIIKQIIIIRRKTIITKQIIIIKRITEGIKYNWNDTKSINNQNLINIKKIMTIKL